MIQSVRNYAHIVNRGLEKEFVVCSRSETSDDPGDDYYNRSQFFCVVIARSAATRQSSGRIPLRSVCHCEERKRRGNPAEPLGNFCIAGAFRIMSQTGLPRPAGLAMTAKRDASENWDETSPRPSLHTLSLRGAQATWQSSGRVRQPPHRPGIPHNISDWIATPCRARNDKCVWMSMSFRHYE